MTNRPTPTVHSDRSGNNLGTLMGLLGLMSIGGGMLGLLAIVIGSVFLMIPVLIAGMVVMGLVHYLAWGWLLTGLQINDVEENDEMG